MGLFSNRQFPWTDLHTLNLDWLLQTVKKLAERPVVDPVAKTEGMTQAVGVDGDGKLFTVPGEGGGGLPAGGEEGQVLTIGEDGEPVWDDIPDQLPEGGTDAQVLTIGQDGQPEWKPLPMADGVNDGIVNPVASDETMTQPVGVDENGMLFTAPGGGGATRTVLWENPNKYSAQSTSVVIQNVNLSDYDEIEVHWMPYYEGYDVQIQRFEAERWRKNPSDPENFYVGGYASGRRGASSSYYYPSQMRLAFREISINEDDSSLTISRNGYGCSITLSDSTSQPSFPKYEQNFLFCVITKIVGLKY